MIERRNAEIVNSFFGCDDSLGWVLQIKYVFGGFGGSYTVFLNNTEKIKELFNVIGVTDFNKIKGSFIRVKADYQTVLEIGHIVKDIWIEI